MQAGIMDQSTPNAAVFLIAASLFTTPLCSHPPESAFSVSKAFRPNYHHIALSSQPQT